MIKTSEQKTVVVLGGYGTVGSTICEALALIPKVRIVIAGRDLAKAQLLAQRLGEQAEPVKLDATNPATYEALLKRASVVINCVEHNNFSVAEQCLSRSVHYVDITATIDVISQLQTLDATAKDANATSVLSVGVAPGLTNLLVRYAHSRLGPLKRADIFIMLGLGENHGAAAIQWTLKQFGRKFTLQSGHTRKEVSAFCDGRTTTMPKPFGRRKAYRFDFSDQHTLPTTLGVDNVNTWMCFDSRAVTWVLWGLTKSRLFSVIPLWRWSNAISRLSHSAPIGGTRFVVQVDAVGNSENHGRFTLVGDGEAQMTGLVAAYVAEHLLSTSTPPGTLHIEQLMDLETLLGKLADRVIMMENMSAPREVNS